MKTKTETATLGGGCFWCLEAVYRQLEGVVRAESGYSGGATSDPTYEDVCNGDTGHAEVVQVEYDPSVLSYRDVLEVFFSIHDPTTLNRQGGDVGEQYRSVIFTHGDAQAKTARELIDELEREGLFDDPIVTQVEPFQRFHIAEGYHQDYFAKNPYQPYCRAVVAPKVAKFRKKWQSRLKAAV